MEHTMRTTETETEEIEVLSSDEYFQSYENLEIHRLMLQDEVRTNAYKEAIYASKAYFNGKVVMDVGAGTGILSLFCAKAGARKVFAVEASNLALRLPNVIERNGFSEIIEVLHSKVEEVKLEEKVDIIVAEWMGFYLLHESMLDSVIFARDNFLKRDTGVLFPSTAQIYAAPCAVEELWKSQIGFWNEKQYEFDLSSFSEVAKIKVKPEVYAVPPDGLLSEPQLLWDLDLKSINYNSLLKFSDRRFFSVDDEVEEGVTMHGVCVWFVCKFPALPNSIVDEDEFVISTAPWDRETHWKQTVLLFPKPVAVESGDIMGWQFIMEKESLESSSRSYKLHLEMLGDEDEHPVRCDCGSVKCEIVKHYVNNQTSDIGDK